MGPMQRVGLALILAVGLAGCGNADTGQLTVQPAPDSMEMHSPAFANGGAIPVAYTCDGADLSPPLTWSGAPDGVEAFALVVEDPDANGFIHWVLTDIPGDLRELPEGQGDVIGAPGLTSFGTAGWGGPCPPSGEHRYAFTLYALSAPLSLGPTPSAAAVRTAAEAVLLGRAQLTGVYARGE
jgi:Raf kinase inhibitor-like YbhB/YbcL family protein